MKITFISDTHTKHNLITSDLPGGDLLIHAGDMSSMGYKHEIESFCKWFNKLDNYETKIFIAGNHDWGFQDHPTQTKEILSNYGTVTYLQDELHMIGENYEDMIKVWGSPWQPEFYNWAFNLPRNGESLKYKWDMIPMNTDILITHGPPFGKLDYVNYNKINVGCEELLKRIEEVKPKIFVCGHIHEGRGYVFDGNTHYFNASILNDRYEFRNKPFTFDWDYETNEVEFI